MNKHSLRLIIIVSFLSLAVCLDNPKIFAQDDNSSNDQSDEQAREAQTQATLDQIHALELKMQDNDKKLDALKKAVDNTENNSVQEAPAQDTALEQVPVEEVPLQTAAPVEQTSVQAAAPVQLASAEVLADQQLRYQAESGPAVALPQAPIYYAPLTGFPKVHTFEISQDDFYSSFKEPGQFNHKGGFYGIYSAYEYRPLNVENSPINVFHFDIHGDYGTEDYDFSGGGKNDKIDNYIIEPRAWMGKDLNLGLGVLTPYIGVGYRWFYDDLKNKAYDSEIVDDSTILYFRTGSIETQFIYIPIGAELSVHPADRWRIDLNGEYDYLVWGQVINGAMATVNYPTNYYIDKTNNNLNNGYGIRGSVKIVNEMDTVNLFVEPYIRYWNIGESKSVTGYMYQDGNPFVFAENPDLQVPKNHSTEIGARLGVEF